MNGFHFTGKIPDYAPDTKSICLPATNIRIILTWIFCAGVKNIPMYIIFYPRISASVRIFCKSMELTRGAEKVTFVSANNHYEVDDLKIQTLLSTDAGVAFYVNVRGVSIFHAGDLNDWKMEHVGELINGKQERTFRHEIRKLADKPVNFAFVPMDPRLGPYQTLGIDFVLKNTDAEFVFPMHMWQDYSAIREYKKHITNLGMADRVIEIERENQVFPFGEL